MRGWSAAAERLFGYEAGEIVGRGARDLTPDMPSEPAVQVETEALRKDGSRVLIALTVTPAAGGGRACRAWEAPCRRDPAVMWSDLTLRRYASDGVVTSDRAGTVIEINPAAERLLGWTRAAALGTDLGQVIADPSLPARVLGGEAVRDQPLDGHLRLHAQPLRDADGAIVGATAVVNDATAADAARKREPGGHPAQRGRRVRPGSTGSSIRAAGGSRSSRRRERGRR